MNKYQVLRLKGKRWEFVAHGAAYNDVELQFLLKGFFERKEKFMVLPVED